MDKQNVLKEIARIANNALYFDDSYDYRAELWEILFKANPELFINDDEPKLEYIKETK